MARSKFSRISGKRTRQRRAAGHRSADARAASTAGKRSVLEAMESRQLMSAAITALTLVNADTAQNIGPFTNGMTLNLSTLPTKSLNVRADVATGTGSVKFGYDSNASY